MQQIKDLANPEGRIVNPEWSPQWDAPDQDSQAA